MVKNISTDTKETKVKGKKNIQATHLKIGTSFFRLLKLAIFKYFKLIASTCFSSSTTTTTTTNITTSSCLPSITPRTDGATRFAVCSNCPKWSDRPVIFSARSDSWSTPRDVCRSGATSLPGCCGWSRPVDKRYTKLDPC